MEKLGMSKVAYKLFNKRKDGTIGPLFINRKLRIDPGVWMEAECHPTKGYSLRPYWHCTEKPEAPHLSEKGRIWKKVMIEGVEIFHRPHHQGGTWYLAKKLMVLND